MINTILRPIEINMKKFISVLFALFFGFSVMAQEDTVQFEGETHFKNVKQLTSELMLEFNNENSVKDTVFACLRFVQFVNQPDHD